MRFYLDNDTDRACVDVIRSSGCECWTTAQAGRSLTADDEQAVYAFDKGAVLVTHDQGFARVQRKNTGGQMILLRCEQPDGPDLLATWLPQALVHLKTMERVVLEFRPESLVVHASRWE